MTDHLSIGVLAGLIHRAPYPVVRNSHEQARSREDWTYQELPTGHDAMIMGPSLVIEALLGAAAEG